MTFSDDIKSKHLGNYVLVTIGDPVIHHISTQKVTLGEQYYKPILLSIPSLSESLDIESRKYKISSVRLSISDYEEDGVRFSDTLNDLMNKEVNIWYASQSSQALNETECYLAGTFIIRSFTQDEDKIGLNCEDLSQDKLHIDLPLNSVPEGIELLSKYRGKPVPMVFGSVDKSPSVLVANEYTNYLNEVNILFDNNEVASVFDTQNAASAHEFDTLVSVIYSPLFIYKDDNYINIPQIAEHNNEIDVSVQFEITEGSSSIKLLYSYSLDGDTYTSENTVAANFLEGNFIKSPISISPIESGRSDYIDSEEVYLSYAPYFDDLQYTKDKMKHTYGYFGISETEGIWVTALTYAGINLEFTPLNVGEIQKRYFLCKLQAFKTTGDNANNLDVRLILQPTPNVASQSHVICVTSGNAPTNVEFDNLFNLVFDHIDISSWGINDTFQIYTYANLASAGYVFNKYYESVLLEYYKIDSPLTLDFYAKVEGRGGEAPTLQKIYGEILGVDILDFSGYDESSADPFSLGQYAFTIDNKINSKKLLEEISASSGLFPYFKDGKFNVKSIKDSHGDTTIIIKTDDIIKYKFSRTSINKVYTKVTVSYHYDYGLKEFTKDTGEVTPTESGLWGTGESIYSEDHFGAGFDQELVFESKYIRDPDTAMNLAKYLCGLHANQHNLITLTLPLNYLELELGDIVKLDKLIQGRKMFGEDYTFSTLRNGQTIYHLFFIDRIKKDLDKVEIRLYQLHKFDIEEGAVSPVSGCTDPNAANYDPLATINNGTCEYDNEVHMGCTNPDALNYNPEATELDGTCVTVSTMSPPLITAPEDGSTVVSTEEDIGTVYSDNLIPDPELNSTFDNNVAGVPSVVVISCQ